MWATGAVVAAGTAVMIAMRRAPAKVVVVVGDFATAPADSQIADPLTDATRRALSESDAPGAAPDVRISRTPSAWHTCYG